MSVIPIQPPVDLSFETDFDFLKQTRPLRPAQGRFCGLAFLNRLSKRYGVDNWLECFIQDEFGLILEEANCISSEFPKNRVNMEKSITSLLNKMNKNYQLVIDPTINSRVLLSVSGINNYNLFKLVERIIKSQAIVKDSNIKKIKDSEVTFEVDFMGELSDLEKIMSANNYFLRQPEKVQNKNLYIILL